MCKQAGFLCTSESFMIDAPVIKGKCPICMQDSRIKVGWLEYHCEKCNNYFDYDCLNIIVKKRREYIGWSLERMAGATELKPGTIKQYEKKWPSKKYYELTAGMVKAHNDRLKQEKEWNEYKEIHNLK